MTDLRERMQTAGGDLPPAPFTIDDLTRAGRRRVRRLRFLTGTAGAVVAVAATVTAVLAVPREQPVDRPVATAPAPAAYGVTFAGYRSGDLRVADPAMVTP